MQFRWYMYIQVTVWRYPPTILKYKIYFKILGGGVPPDRDTGNEKEKIFHCGMLKDIMTSCDVTS